MKHLEIEYKTLLSQKEFQSLLPHFSNVQPVTQTNYYIDTPDRAIKGKKMSLRIRILHDRAEMTLKVPQTVGNLEYNQELDYDQARQLVREFQMPQGDLADTLQQQGILLADLVIWGELTTTRREQESPIGLMALDDNLYCDRQDYELEIEVTDAQQGKKDFEAFLKQKKIAFKYATSKVARVAATLTSAK